MDVKTRTQKSNQQKIYQQKFRQEWKTNPKLKDWLREHEAKPNRAYCIYCKCGLISKYCDLIGHATTKKHLRAAIATQQEQLNDSLPMIKNVTTLYANNELKVEMIKTDNRKKKIPQNPIEYVEELPGIDTNLIEDDEDEEEMTQILTQAEEEFETISAIPNRLREAKIKAEIEYYRQKTQYFAKLTENSKIHKTLMILQARKLNLEIKKMQNDY